VIIASSMEQRSSRRLPGGEDLGERPVSDDDADAIYHDRHRYSSALLGCKILEQETRRSNLSTPASGARVGPRRNGAGARRSETDRPAIHIAASDVDLVKEFGLI
jgi:hypothetical protein